MKERETRGRKAAAVETAATAPPPSPAIDKGEDPRKQPAAADAAIQKRANWSTGGNLARRITAAVTEWKSGSGRAAPREFLGETEARKPTTAEFAMLVEIPKGALGSYLTTPKGKARVGARGDVLIIGDKKAKKKHEAKTGVSRVLTTMHRIGSVAGATGPAGFLMAGTKKRHGYSNEQWWRNPIFRGPRS